MQSQAEFPAFKGCDGTRNSTRSGGENPKAHGNWSRGVSVEAMRAKLRNSDQRQVYCYKAPRKTTFKIKSKVKRFGERYRRR